MSKSTKKVPNPQYLEIRTDAALLNAEKIKLVAKRQAKNGAPTPFLDRRIDEINTYLQGLTVTTNEVDLEVDYEKSCDEEAEQYAEMAMEDAAEANCQ